LKSLAFEAAQSPTKHRALRRLEFVASRTVPDIEGNKVELGREVVPCPFSFFPSPSPLHPTPNSQH